MILRKKTFILKVTYLKSKLQVIKKYNLLYNNTAKVQSSIMLADITTKKRIFFENIN
jgi:hypothetical protein